MLEKPIHNGEFGEFAVEQDSDRARQEALYLGSGITIEKAADILPHINEELEKEHKRIQERIKETPDAKGTLYYYFMYHPEYAFYLNSSDSLNTLYKAVDVKDQRVLTVAGSGDFSEIFAAKGASQVDVMDYSTPACFWNELKLVAAKHLDYEAYYAMFGPIDKVRDKDLDYRKRIAPIFDADIYQYVSKYLSPQAQVFFDTMRQMRFANIFLADVSDRESKHGQGVVRFRGGKISRFEETKMPQEMPLLKNPTKYKELRRAMKTLSWSVRQGDITRPDNDFSQYDFVYISNVGYRNEHIASTAYNALQRGAKRVGFTLAINDEPHGEAGKKLEGLSRTLQHKFHKEGSKTTSGIYDEPVNLEFYEELPGQENVDRWNRKRRGPINLKSQIRAVDIDRWQGYYLEAKSEDNQD